MKAILSACVFGCLLFTAVWGGAVNAMETLLADQAIFQSITAQISTSDGTPVGPPTKVTMCHNGRTIIVAQSAVPAHLAQGDTLGPCP